MRLKIIRIGVLAICAVCVFTVRGKAQSSNDKLSIFEYNDLLLTHLLTPAGPIPTAFDPNGVYPYMSYSE
ncbi:MAG TPA: hypothetical protein VFH08_13210, partial [Chitinophagaceae bacterium]|nr:hypothetical protein [Chitinophagaceae bacterium]